MLPGDILLLLVILLSLVLYVVLDWVPRKSHFEIFNKLCPNIAESSGTKLEFERQKLGAVNWILIFINYVCCSLFTNVDLESHGRVMDDGTACLVFKIKMIPI